VISSIGKILSSRAHTASFDGKDWLASKDNMGPKKLEIKFHGCLEPQELRSEILFTIQDVKSEY
jgi:hypothetical protein